MPPNLAAVVVAAMAKDPAGRPPSADAFGHALRAVQRADRLAVTEMAVMTTEEDPAGTRALDLDLDRPLAHDRSLRGHGGRATWRLPPDRRRPRRGGTRWLVIAGIVVVLLLAAGAVALTRDRSPAVGPPEAIGLQSPGDGDPGPPTTTTALAGPTGEKDVTPQGKPVPLVDAGQSASARLAANEQDHHLRFAGT